METCGPTSLKKTNRPVFLLQDESHCFFLYDNTDGLKAEQNRGPFEKIAFQRLYVCGWTARCVHIHSPGPGVHADNINKRAKKEKKAALWWIREPDEKCCYKLATKAPQRPWGYPCSLSITEHRGLL